MPSAIFNVYPPARQWERMWEGKSLPGELQLCPGRELARHLIEVLRELRDPVIVEAGCGVGAWVAYLAEQNFHHVIAVDNYVPALEELKRHAPDSTTIEADVRNLPFADNSVDTCISLGVVEHFPDGPQSIIREMHRVLRPGGYMFLTVPYYNAFRRLLIHPLRAAYMAMKKARGQQLYFVEYRFTREEMVGIVRQCGFEIVRVVTDEYEGSNQAIGLYVDFPPFRGNGEFKLNAIGRAVRSLSCKLNPWLTSGGMLVLGRKTAANQ